MSRCPRNFDNMIWQEYKLVKRLFRQEQKRAIKEYETRHMREFLESNDVDVKYYWHLVNQSRKVRVKNVTPVKLENGKIITDVNNIKQAWKEYFEQMYTKQDCETFDNVWYKHVTQSIPQQHEKSIKVKSVVFKDDFTNNELIECIKCLKLRKACGWDNISAENIKYGGEILRSCILYLCNQMLKSETMPIDLKKGVLVPIPKSGKDATMRENNRGITLLPIIHKLYQNLLIHRYGTDMENKIDTIQLAGRKATSCLHTSLTLRETLQYNIEKGKSVFMSFLDVQKAFDNIWIDGLMFKLFIRGIDTKFWRIVKDMYIGFKGCVRVMNVLTDWFSIAQGIQQGAPLSMWLYQMYVNDLLETMRESKLGAHIDDINITCPAFADDVVIIATSSSKLQCLLDMAHAHSSKWRYRFNVSKSEAICFDRNNKSDTVLWLGNEKLNIRKSCVHLGTMITADKKCQSEFVKSKITKSKQILASVRGIGTSRVPVPVLGKSKLYWSLCVPLLTYGAEIACYDQSICALLDRAHCSIAKHAQSLPDNTPNVCALQQLRWLTMSGYIDLLKLMFMWRVLSISSVTSLHKQIVIKRLLKSYSANEYNLNSPVANWLHTAKKYDLVKFIFDGMNSGNYMSITKWKNTVMESINRYEMLQRMATQELYVKCYLYKQCVQRQCIWPWYILSYKQPNLYVKCVTMMRLMLGIELVNDNYTAVNYCTCTQDKVISVAHVLFECSLLKSDREHAWNLVSLKSPKPFVESVSAMNIIERTKFIFCGFNSVYIPEHETIYLSILTYVCSLVKIYKNKNNYLRTMS